MKTENGITMVMLVITVIVLLLVATATINFGTDSVKSTRFQNFSYELQQIQGKVDTLYEKIKLGNRESITFGRNITESEEAMNTLKTVKGIDYLSISDAEREKYYYNDSATYYRYLEPQELQKYLDISNSSKAVIINFTTREVISVEGFEFEGIVYYRLEEI